MMGRSILALLAVACLGGCNFAVKHPAVTAGIVAGTVGLGSCELSSGNHKACFAISGGAGVGLALITAFALWIGYEDEDPVATDGTTGKPVDPSNLEPAPVFVPTPDQQPKPEVKPEPKPPEPKPAEPTPTTPTTPVEPTPAPPP